MWWYLSMVGYSRVGLAGVVWVGYANGWGGWG